MLTKLIYHLIIQQLFEFKFYCGMIVLLGALFGTEAHILICCVMCCFLHRDKFLLHRGLLETIVYSQQVNIFLLEYILLKILTTSIPFSALCFLFYANHSLTAWLTLWGFFSVLLWTNTVLSLTTAQDLPILLIWLLTLVFTCPFIFLLLSYVKCPESYVECFVIWGLGLILSSLTGIIMPIWIRFGFETLEQYSLNSIRQDEL